MATSTLHDVFESDVNVQIGEGEDLEVIHGCAAAMAKASRPFDKMLHGGFSEGLTPAGTRMKTVVLLDDDPSSVKLVLRIVCSPVEQLAPVDSVEDVCGLAAVADKYECNVIVGNVVKRWTETWDTGSGEALYMQLCICASLNFSDDFRKHTATMARQDISIDLNDTQNPATKQLSLPSGLTGKKVFTQSQVLTWYRRHKCSSPRRQSCSQQIAPFDREQQACRASTIRYLHILQDMQTCYRPYARRIGSRPRPVIQDVHSTFLRAHDEQDHRMFGEYRQYLPKPARGHSSAMGKSCRRHRKEGHGKSQRPLPGVSQAVEGPERMCSRCHRHR